MKGKKYIAYIGIGEPDVCNDVIMPGAFKNEITGLCVGFKKEADLIGYVDVFEEDNNIVFRAEIPERYSNLVPCIGFETIKTTINNDGNIVVEEMDLRWIALCAINFDNRIKPINEQ